MVQFRVEGVLVTGNFSVAPDGTTTIISNNDKNIVLDPGGTGGVELMSKLVLNAGGVITTKADGDITLTPEGSGSVVFSDMTAGSLFFAGVDGVLSQDNAGLYYDDTNNRVGIGTNEFGVPLEITPAIRLQSAAGVYINNRHNQTDAEKVISSGSEVTEYLAPVVLADDASFDLPASSSGFGEFLVEDGEEYTRARWTSAGVVTLMDESTNVVNTDTDTNFCIFDNGTSVRVRNRLGSSKKVMFSCNYHTDAPFFYTLQTTLNPIDVKLTITAGNTVVIDWGDGNTDAVVADGTEKTTNHSYSATGHYRITLTGDYEGITGLNLASEPVYGDVAGLSPLTGLTMVFINDNEFSGDASAFSAMTSMSWFFLDDTNITGDLSAFAGMTSISRLTMNNTGITGNLNELAPLTTATDIYMQNCDIQVNGDALPSFNLCEFRLQECNLTSDSFDNLHILINNAGGTSSGARIYVTGKNSSGSSAATAALAALAGRGYTLTNNRATPPLCVEGDSISVATSWPSEMAGTVWSAGTEYNYALGGDRAALMPAQYADQGRIVKPWTGLTGFYLLMAGTNDLANGAVAADVFANLSAIWAEAKTDGYDVIAFEVLPSLALTGLKEANRIALNALIAAASSEWDAYVPVPSLLTDASNVTYYVDGTHLTTAGAVAMAADVDLIIDAV